MNANASCPTRTLIIILPDRHALALQMLHMTAPVSHGFCSSNYRAGCISAASFVKGTCCTRLLALQHCTALHCVICSFLATTANHCQALSAGTGVLSSGTGAMRRRNPCTYPGHRGQGSFLRKSAQLVVYSCKVLLVSTPPLSCPATILTCAPLHLLQCSATAYAVVMKLSIANSRLTQACSMSSTHANC